MSNFHPLEGVSLGSETQLYVGEKFNNRLICLSGYGVNGYKLLNINKIYRPTDNIYIYYTTAMTGCTHK